MKVCAVTHCDRRATAKGYCNPHYLRSRRGKPMDKPIRPKSVQWVGCLVEGCDRDHHSKGFCTTHYKQQQTFDETPAADRVQDALGLDGGWLTTAGIQLVTGYSESYLETVLEALVETGRVVRRVVGLSSRYGKGPGEMETRVEWRVK